MLREKEKLTIHTYGITSSKEPTHRKEEKQVDIHTCVLSQAAQGAYAPEGGQVGGDEAGEGAPQGLTALCRYVLRGRGNDGVDECAEWIYPAWVMVLVSK